MVLSSVMTVFMAGEEKPVFHDFLGIAGQREDFKQPGVVILDGLKGPKSNAGLVVDVEGEVSTKASSINSGRFEECSAPVTLSEHLSWAKDTGSQHLGNKSTLHKHEGDNRQAKRRDVSNSKDSSQEQPQIGMDALDSSRILKVLRLDRQDERRSRSQDVGVDDLHLAMQPPRMSSKFPHPHPSAGVKADLPNVGSKKWDSLRSVSLNTGIYGTARTGHMGPMLDKMAASNSRENTVMPVVLPPADEGSRTGLKGSGVANLIDDSSGNPGLGTACLSIPSGRSKLWSQNAGSESTFMASQQTTAPTSRQLTIFYGGQAHVFDDVPPDKAEAIMTLAGSSGRSWSTIYSPHPKAKLPSSASEGSLSTFKREKDKSVSQASAMNGFSNLALSTEIHNALSISTHLRRGGSLTGHADADFDLLMQGSTDMQTTPDRIGSCSKRQEGNEAGKELN